MYHYTECGLDNVRLKNGYEIIIDPEYGECVSIADRRGLHKSLASHIVNHSPTLSGAEFRFLRKEMNQSQAALARLFNVSEQTIARYEKGETKAPRTTDACLRAMYLGAQKQTAWAPHLLKKITELEAAARGPKPRKSAVFTLTKSAHPGWKAAA